VDVVTSFGFYHEYHDHPKEEFFNVVEGFKTNSTVQPNIEIQFYGRYFCATIDALRASWAGRTTLFRHLYWVPLLRTVFKASWSIFTCRRVEPSNQAFRLKDAKEGYWIKGSWKGFWSTYAEVVR